MPSGHGKLASLGRRIMHATFEEYGMPCVNPDCDICILDNVVARQAEWAEADRLRIARYGKSAKRTGTIPCAVCGTEFEPGDQAALNLRCGRYDRCCGLSCSNRLKALKAAQ